MRRTIIVATFLLLAFSLVPLSLGEVVYNSLPFTQGGAGGDNGQLAQAIRLSGVMRQASQFEVGIGASSPYHFRIQFYELDGTGGTPGTMIWQSPTQTYPYVSPLYNRKVISVDVPSITVPDMFAWVVESELPAGNMLLLSSNQPTVGESFQSWYRVPGQDWVEYHVNTNVYGARITAVPEPFTLLLLNIGAISLLGYRKAKSHG